MNADKFGNSWKKSFIVIEIDSNGVVTEKFQIQLALNEETASVETIKEKIKDQLGYEVCLLDSKTLPIVSSDLTKGSQFWRSARKILVARQAETKHLARKNQRKSSKAKDLIAELKRMMSESGTEKEDKRESDPKSSPSVAPKPAKEVLEELFQCTICLATAQFPAACCSRCLCVIGCIPCIEQWIESSASLSQCPLCRTTNPYEIIPLVRGLATLLGQSLPDNDQTPLSSSTEAAATPFATLNEDGTEDDEDLMHPMI